MNFIKSSLAIGLFVSTTAFAHHDDLIGASVDLTFVPTEMSMLSSLVMMTESGLIDRPHFKELIIAAKDDAAMYVANVADMSPVLAEAIQAVRTEEQFSQLSDMEIATLLSAVEF